jgi:hypothetical protein
VLSTQQKQYLNTQPAPAAVPQTHQHISPSIFSQEQPRTAHHKIPAQGPSNSNQRTGSPSEALGAGQQARRSKAVKKAARCPADPDQAEEEHHKVQIKKKEKGTRIKPDTNFSSSKKFSNKVNNQEQALVSVLIIITEKIRGGNRITLSTAERCSASSSWGVENSS